MLLVLPVPFLVKGNQLFFESQACNGIEQWADNFDSIIVAAPAIPEAIAAQDKTIIWRDTKTLASPKRFELVPLPWSYKIKDFLFNYYSVRARLAKLIKRSDYLQFAIGGLIGDWAAVAAQEARKQGREYAVHTDRVEHKVLLETAKTASCKKRLKAVIMAPLMAMYHQQLIRDCSLGLFHGQDCYSEYSQFCQNSHLIHNIHLKPQDGIEASSLREKIEDAKSDRILRICYAGRIDPEKAPLDWVKAIGHARDLGINLHATWIGDGSLLNEMKALIHKLNLNSCIELTGLETNRERLLTRIRESHIMVFTHVTPESPRCLIEALASGTPIIGYGSDYSQDLVNYLGGGAFVPMHEWKKLGNLIANLFADRQKLSKLIQQAGKNGSRFSDEAVFRHRSDLIKKYLPVPKFQENLLLAGLNNV